ncbi:ATP-binding cassette domain-containing protein [Profundibacterium mesophilum]|uniref:ABC-transporter ATP-binding subunit n=1 Tax=Profundibacterium mesophilum KAUST100406-0324 TaxID=1037889 RepID=A0A921NVD0_9RHOB|nr:ATP-binding cassette domain-containing protein [Profundibacterium mesophilum]KAF0677374.1 ABC-transporter ATP-binding subunit [Profundibacterium mesophilum KAUST100406-0324]
MNAAVRHEALTPGGEAFRARLRVRGLRKSAGGVLRISIDELGLAPGGVTMVLGANGAGKSLLLRLLHGLVLPDEGTIAAPPGVQSMVFQRPVLLRRSVFANLDFALKIAGIGRAERHRSVRELLSRHGFGDRAGQPARSLSGGEQQRLAMIRALSVSPAILFLDEPSASLDPAATSSIEALIRSAARQGTKVVMVTHDPGQARRLGDEVLLLHRGRIAEQGPAAEFFAGPVSGAGRAYLDGSLYLDP